MRKITVDYVVSSDGRTIGEIWLDADDIAVKAMLADLDVNPNKRAAAGFNDVCNYHGAAPGLTRWHHLQSAGVVSGVPPIHPPAVNQIAGESANEYATRIQKVGV